MSQVAGYVSYACMYGDHDCDLKGCLCDCRDQNAQVET